jgi:hypothetical protein
VVVDTQSDLPHARQMIGPFGKVWKAMPRQVINTHEDGDHVWGNQLFEGAEIIAHRSVRELMQQIADPKETQQLIEESDRFLSRLRLSALHPGALALVRQLKQDHDFEDIRLVLPTTVFDEQHALDLDGTEVQLIYMGPCHQIGDTIVHVPEEKVVFAGDVIFRECTPMGWNGGPREGLRRGPGSGPCQGHRGRVLTRLTKSMSLAMKLIRSSQGRSSAWAPSRTAPAWTTTISPTRSPRSRSASNGWSGCAAASPNRRASCRPAAGRCGRRCRDSMARSWRVGASRADVSFKWSYQR